MGRRIPYFQCLMVILFMSISLIINVIFFKRPVYVGLIIGIIAAFIVALANGYKFTEILKMMYKGLSKNLVVILILSMIGILIGIWKIGGVIPAMLFYSFGIINKKAFLLSAFVISTMISLLMGTSSGTVSTTGIVLIGLGSAMGFPPEVTAGAVVSGAFVGDRSSPIASVMNVISALTETKTHENFKYFWKTMSVGMVLTAILYFIIGLLFKGYDTPFGTAEQYKQLLSQLFYISPWLMLPPIVLIGFSIFRIPTVYSMAVSIMISGIFSVLFQKISLLEVLNAAFLGYKPSIPVEYSQVLVGGGLLSFKTMLIVLICVTSLNGIFEGTGMTETIITPFLKKINNERDLQLFTIVLSIGSAIFFCNQLMAIIIPAGILKKRYRDMNIDNRTLALLLADSGVMASSLIPWNVAALTPASIMGVSVMSYLPYAFLGYIMPIITAVNVLYYTNKSKNTLMDECL